MKKTALLLPNGMLLMNYGKTQKEADFMPLTKALIKSTELMGFKSSDCPSVVIERVDHEGVWISFPSTNDDQRPWLRFDMTRFIMVKSIEAPC